MSKFLLNLSSPAWKNVTDNESEISVRGTVFSGQKIKTTSDIARDLFESNDVLEKIDNLLIQQNGFHAITFRKTGLLFASVDRVRSIPLFYGQSAGVFFLSDDAEWVRQQVGDDSMDNVALEEFLLAGYVTGQDTLYSNVKQLQAGEYLIAEEHNHGVSLQIKRYFRFLHLEPDQFNETELSVKLKTATNNSIKRLIDYANGRQIVLPLSGGYDSRLIAVLLKKHDYQNVLCFTYGVPGNKEAEYSRRVAKALGFDWTFVEYSNEVWAREWASPEAHDYRRMAANHVSLPHVQDWAAIKILLERQQIYPDSIVVPGHSGDFVAGSHIPNLVFTKKDHSQDDMVRALIADHLSNIPKNGMRISKGSTLESRVLGRVNLPFDGSDVCFANLYETWDWQERQSKYIVNSVRVYDQFNLDWWLPLWDAEFFCFWEGVPLVLRKNRTWFKQWITKLYLENSNEPQQQVINNASDASKTYETLKKIARLLPDPVFKIIKKAQRKSSYENHFLAFGGLVKNEKLKLYQKNNYNIIGIYSDLFIKGQWGDK